MWKTTYQSITPEDTESFITGHRSMKAAIVNPFHEFGHQPPKMYTNSPNIGNQLAMLYAPKAPLTPKSRMFTNIQDKRMWSTNEAADNHPIIEFLSCACKYIWIVKAKIKEYKIGINHKEIASDATAISSSSPNTLNMGVVKMKIGNMIVAVTISMSHDRCK